MAKKKDEEEEFVIDSTSKVSTGQVNRYEVRISPPAVGGGRKVRPVREAADGSVASAPSPDGTVGRSQQQTAPGMPVMGTQQIFKIEDDLRRTRELVEDLRHTSSILEGDVRDLKA